MARADQRLNAGEEEAEHGKHRLSIDNSSPREVLPSDRRTVTAVLESIAALATDTVGSVGWVTTTENRQAERKRQLAGRGFEAGYRQRT